MKNYNYLNKEADMLQKLFNNNIDWFGNNMFHTNRMRMNGVPPVNIAETDNGFTIEMAAPGYQKQDFQVSVDKNLLTITVDNKETETQENSNPSAGQTAKDSKRIYRREFIFGGFSRSFSLPDGVDGDKISGTYENGILSLSIPKAEIKATRTSVEIR